MLIFDVYVLTGGAAFAIYLTYHRIDQGRLPDWWQNTVGRAHILFFQRWLDQLNRKSTEPGNDDELFDVPAAVIGDTPTWVRVCQAERETFVQLNDLCRTDVIKVEAGEMIPMNGVVVEGSAWVLIHQNPLDFHLTAADIPVNLQQLTAGDPVEAQKIVLVGSLKILPEVPG